MNNLIELQATKILMNIREVFIYFYNTDIDHRAQQTISELIEIVRLKKKDDDIDTSSFLNKISDFNEQMNISAKNILMRRSENDSEAQTLETQAICNLINARVEKLKAML